MLSERLCNGQVCRVIGSAPNLVLPKPKISETIMGANGGAGIAFANLYPVHVLCTTAYLFRPSPTEQEQATLEQIHGVAAWSAYVDTSAGPLDYFTAGAAALELAASKVIGVSPEQRDEVTIAALGDSAYKRVSTGVWAACLAIASGASHVSLHGISLTSGHHGQPDDMARRDHVHEDRVALIALKMLGVETPTIDRLTEIGVIP